MLPVMGEGLGPREVEIKLAVRSAAWARRQLASKGFRSLHKRTLQRDVVLDSPTGTLRRAGALLRLRRAGGAAWITYKGPAAPGRHKNREELELRLSARAAAQLEQILGRLGFRAVFRYEKYRTEFGQAGRSGVVALDETPIGVFLELEGTPRWIDRTARKLGFTESHYITATYAELYLEDCRRRGHKPADMLFATAG